MKRRSLLAGAGAAVLAAPLSGCDWFGQERRTRLVVWQTETDEGAKDELDRLRRAFETSHPDVEVLIEAIPWGSLAARLNTAIRTDSLPDIAHVQPFMAYSLVERGLLEPISDLVAELDRGDRILPAVRDLQRFNGEHYGLAYAVGITGWTFDLSKASGLPLPYPEATTGGPTTTQVLDYLQSVRGANPEATVLLPGGTPFFIDQLVGELVSNAGGRLYDVRSGEWLFESPEVRAAFQFLLQLRERSLLDPDWQSQSYTDQFPRLAAHDGVFVTPVTYARARVAIERTLKNTDRSDLADDANFRFVSPPVFPEARAKGVRDPIATIDCEPFVVFRKRAAEPYKNGTKRDLCIDFLKAFFEPTAYLRFCQKVPIHLTPIFTDVADSEAYRGSFAGFEGWHDHTMAYLRDAWRTRPILVAGHDPSTLEADLKNPYLLDLQARNVISDAVVKLLTDPRPDLGAVLAEAQRRAKEITERGSAAA